MPNPQKSRKSKHYASLDKGNKNSLKLLSFVQTKGTNRGKGGGHAFLGQNPPTIENPPPPPSPPKGGDPPTHSPISRILQGPKTLTKLPAGLAGRTRTSWFAHPGEGVQQGSGGSHARQAPPVMALVISRVTRSHQWGGCSTKNPTLSLCGASEAAMCPARMGNALKHPSCGGQRLEGEGRRACDFSFVGAV